MTSTRGPIRSDPTAALRKGGTLSSRLEPVETIIVVEDERDIATFLRAYFRASGTEVVHVDPTSPADVCDAVATHEPVCVLLDLNLRGFDGLDAFRELRAIGFSMPVIVVTADAHPSTKTLALREGVAAVVHKPFSVKGLCELVRALTV
jgi:DNA-binding response OmpR family regulator